MKVLGWEFAMRKAVHDNLPEAKANQFDDVLQRLVAAQAGYLGGLVNPENCERSPTMKAIVTAIARRLAVSPVHVYKKGEKNGRETREKQPNHPVAKLLSYPNDYQSRVSYWLDAASTLVRYNNYVAVKGRGQTGPIRSLWPLQGRAVSAEQDDDLNVTYLYSSSAGQRRYTTKQVHHVRGVARNFYWGDSPVEDVSVSIALEIMAEKFGATFFQNGALPLLIFKYMQGMQPFKDKEGEKKFIEDFQSMFSGNKAHRAMLMPKGIEAGDPIAIDNDKAQFLETRKYQRTVIAGAFGVPPHLVGDLERATFNNVEQQDSDFTLNVVMPFSQSFEAGMERDLLTDEDWSNGISIRFNLDSTLRADFKSRQEGLQIQRANGVICPDEWREIEGRNPLDDDKGGEDYLRPANMVVAGAEPLASEPPPAAADDTEDPLEKAIRTAGNIIKLKGAA